MTNRGGEGRIQGGRSGEGFQFASGDNLTPQKARILLMLALTRTKKIEGTSSHFSRVLTSALWGFS